MANYYATVRTNYFRVTDESRFRKIIEAMSCEDTVQLFEEDIEGRKLFGFGCHGNIIGLIDYASPDDVECEDRSNNAEYDDDPDYDKMIEELQAVLHPDDAIIIMEAGYEKLRYVIGACTVITCNEVRFVNMQDSALILAREMLQNPDYQTRTEY